VLAATTRTYLAGLERLKSLCDAVPNTTMMAAAKIGALVALNMRYERIMVNRQLERHPYDLVSELIDDASRTITASADAGFISGDAGSPMHRQPAPMEQRHQELFQALWTKFSEVEYQARIDRFTHRLNVNGLASGFLDGRRCIDFGCGHGNFAHALVRAGASFVYGLDYGAASIRYAQAARDRLGVGPERIEFVEASVYRVLQPDATYDFAVQNGVFHHLDDEDAAIREVSRVLKPGAWFWVYTDGAGAISHDLWDASVFILRDVPVDFILRYLDSLALETGKRYHLGDGLSATYRHATWAEVTERLSRHGFGNVRRLVGGFPTDFDHDAIAADRYGVEKFGEGDLRCLAMKL
jgi:ubiquinone/menaquinone biosynthesis C-methylase UbiE